MKQDYQHEVEERAEASTHDETHDGADDEVGEERDEPRVRDRKPSLVGRLSARFEGAWSTLMYVCLIVAAALLLIENMDAAFVVGTIGVVAWFLDFRNRLLAANAGTGVQSVRYADESNEHDSHEE